MIKKKVAYKICLFTTAHQLVVTGMFATDDYEQTFIFNIVDDNNEIYFDIISIVRRSSM